MADDGHDRMMKVDPLKDPSLSQAHLDYIRKVEKKNLDRVRELKNVRRRNLATGFALAAGIASVYLYSMYAVKQENFLDDFEEPLTQNKPTVDDKILK